MRGARPPGHRVGSVAAGSPADAAGLRVGDRVVELDGRNVEQAAYQDVVDRVHAPGDHIVLLVVDADADQFFSERNIAVSATMDGVETISCPLTTPPAAIGRYSQPRVPL